MVKTRSQNSKNCATRSTIITEGVVTRSNSKSKTRQHKHAPVQQALKKKELPRVELTDRIKTRLQTRQQLRKQIHQNQTSILNEIHTDVITSKTQNNQEMTSVWKNFESVFKYIDDFMQFKKRVEGNSTYLI
jgi:predicted nucleic acid-binding OB-fold protein